ncbi:hypothetical protein Acsp04_52570 [Actinomadura sp. NBRC 104425]|uniref:RHS repeat-associated core domain-containing protein n=1 Tax=Actinomadura sp. NBRC 104425 TaxID=3032204 RepID=UPI0024A34928|nr:RHS repeat-associated core domain-containing protein [Actinomadura sp. NBRC 104425]GLZ15022.1 hypothetical protein Acsp04_52570 [Actinomadura sp. NBRC 104425]
MGDGGGPGAPAGSSLSYKYEVCEKNAADGSAVNCFDSGYVRTHAWTVPAGKLSWSKTYLWRVFVKDTGNEVPSERVMFQTAVPQPEITSRLAGAQEREFDPHTGNFSTSAVDASVANVGPELSLERTYNSLDPRRDSPFGAGWTTQFDMRLTEDKDGSGNVVIGYPDGQQVRYGRNPDGTFSPPPGRHATLTVNGSTWKLTDKTGRTFEFVNTRLTKITDPGAQSVTLTYDPLTGRLSRATAAGGRYLSFTWSGDRVAAVSTNPVDGKALTWTYTYTGDLLTKVCAPGDRCTAYEYAPGSHYRSVVMDTRPESYWRLGEAEGTSAASQVAINLGEDAAAYKNVTLQAPGALTGTDNTAAAFNGTTSQVTLPGGALKKSRDLAVEVWFKNNPTASGGPLVGYQDKPLDSTSAVGVPVLYTGLDGRLRGQFYSGGTISPITSAVAVNDGKWHHAVLSAMGSTQTLYLDGKVVGTLTGQTPDHLDLTYNQLGAAYASTPASWPQWGTAARRFYTGTLDEVAVYHHPLGPAQVAAHYTEALRTADQLTKVTLPSGKVAAEASYDTAADRVAEYTDRDGGTWKIKPPTVYGGDADLRRAVEVRDPADRPYLYESDAITGNLIRVGIPLGLETREEDRPEPSPSPSPTCNHPDPGDPAFCTDPPGNPGDIPDFVGIPLTGMGMRTFQYDDRGFPTVVTNENGDSAKFTHDARGNVTSRTTCRSKDVCHTAYFTYPSLTDPADPRNDKPIEFRDGRSTSATDNRYRTGYTYTTSGKLLTQTNPEGGGQIGYTYTTGAEAAVGGGTMPPGLVLTAHPDAADRTWTTGYDAAGNPVRLVAPGGVTRERSFDPGNRLLRETGTGPSAPSAERVFGYDSAGRLIKVNAGSDTNVYTWNDRGELLTAEGPSGQATMTYDADGRLTGRTDAAGTAAFGYSRGRLQTLQDGITGVTQTFGYNTAGQLNKIDYGSGRIRTFDYDDLGRVTADTLKNGSGATVASITYGYDDNDRTTRKTTAGTAGAGENTYAYDRAGRLKAWTRDGATTEYDWDASGNRVRAGSVTATYDERNRRLTEGQTTFAYTPRGTLAAASAPGGGENYTFDAFDRLTAAGPTTYTYDGLDRIATRNGAPFGYAGPADDPVTDGAHRYSRGLADDVVAVDGGAGGRVALADKHGDVVGAFDPAAPLAAVADSSAYDPFGRRIAHSGAWTNVGYQGDWTDPDSGQVKMGARWYSPESGAFNSRDSLTLDPTPYSVNANRYTYGNADPLDNADPTGHYAVGPIAGGLLAARLAWLAWRAWRAYRVAQLIKITLSASPPPARPWSTGWDSWYDRFTACPGVPCQPGGKGDYHRSGPSRGGYAPGRSGYYGGNVGLSAAQRAAIARALAIARARARTAAAKRRAEKDARNKARKISPSLRKPSYADPASRISTGPARKATRARSYDVVKDTVRSLQAIRQRAVDEAGSVVSQVTLPVVVPLEVPVGQPAASVTGPPPPTSTALAPSPPNPSPAPASVMQTAGLPAAGSAVQDDDEECVPRKNYGGFDKNGYHSGAYARFCTAQDLAGGSAASKDIDPPGWPKRDPQTGKSTNRWLTQTRQYEFARCHLIGNQLGGDGYDANNLITCYQSPVNTPVMRGLENRVAEAVRDGQVVDYWVKPVYESGDVIPDKIRLTARGRYPDGRPGIDLDRCLINQMLPKNRIERSGSVCGP